MKSIKSVIFPINHYISKYGIWIIFLIFLASTFGFFLNQSLDNQSLDYLRISQWNVQKIIFENYGDQLPLWFLIAKVYTSIFGNSEFAIRIFSVVIFLLSAFVLYKLCEIYKINKYLVTSLYLANPLLLQNIDYAFKHWSFLILISLAILYFFEKFELTKEKKYFLLLIISSIAGIYSNLVFLIYLFPFLVYFLINSITNKTKIKFFLIFLIITVVFISPLFFYFTKAQQQLMGNRGPLNQGIQSTGISFIETSLSLITGTNLLSNGLSVFFWLIILFLLLFQLTQNKWVFAYLARYIKPIIGKKNILSKEDKTLKTKEFSFTRLWLISSVFLVVIVFMIARSFAEIRDWYLGITIPFFYLAIFPKSKKFYITLLVIVLLILTIFSSITMAHSINNDDWKGVANFLKPRIKEDTQILMLYHLYGGSFVLEYYLDRPVEILYKIDNPLVIKSDDVWIVRRHGEYNSIYTLSYKYNIEEYNNFANIRIIHLVKRKNNEKSNNLIFNNAEIEIVDGSKTEKVQFSDGSMPADCCKEDWQRIRLDEITSGGENKICLFTHPRNNEKINLTYKNIELSKSIKFTTGLSDNMVLGDLSPVYMDVYIDNVFLKRIIQPDIKGWFPTEVDTSQYKNKLADVKLVIYADYDEKRHFCFDAEVVDENAPNDYFYQNIKNATAEVENRPCDIYQTTSIWPHNETKPPLLDSKIFERWDCEMNLISKKKIWNTIGKSYAISDNEFKEAIWFHPVTNKIKSLEYKNINLEVGKITGFYGLNDYALPKTSNPTLIFTITANGEKIYEDKFSPTKGWKNFEIPINKKLENVVFSITTNNDSWNHFFFNAFLE